MIDNILHGHDGMCIEAVLFLDLFQCADFTAQSLLHTVQGYHQTNDLYVGSSSYLGNRLFHRLTGSGNVLDHDNSVAVF